MDKDLYWAADRSRDALRLLLIPTADRPPHLPNRQARLVV